MPFPSNPSNGQSASLNNVTYTYNSSLNAWVKSGTIFNIVVTSTVDSTSGTTGAVIVAGGGGFGGRVTARELAATNGIIINSNQINTSTTIPSGSSAHSVGPITQVGGTTVTLQGTGRWVIV